MNGVWTFLIPQQKGGGVIVANNGKLYGGDIGYFLQGTYVTDGESVQGTLDALMFNVASNLTSVWGDNARSFKVTFTGKRSGDEITGQIQRTGVPMSFPVTLTRRADVP